MSKIALIALFAMITSVAAIAQDRPTYEPLWSKGAPGAMGTEPKDIPALQWYKPDAGKANGCTVVVCPGGGYGGLAEHEGYPIAKWLNSFGVTAAVLRYRLAPYRHPCMINDANRAIRVVRSRAAELGLDPKRVGILGFSAGGHLTSTAVTHFDAGDANAADPIDKFSCRPDFGVLCYAVIELNPPFAHMGSRYNLLGMDAPQSLVDSLSNDKMVTEKTPPCFLWSTADDQAVPMENSLLFAMACRKFKVPVELHIYEHGPHGMGLGGNDPSVSTWPGQCEKWMAARGFLKSVK
ncbi:MAG: alpha/beta hydrolase [Chthonomonadales bacterium]